MPLIMLNKLTKKETKLMKLSKAYVIFSRLAKDISMLEDYSGKINSEFDMEYPNDPEERYKYNIAQELVEKLEEFSFKVKWVTTPDIIEGRLVKAVNGQYEIEGENWCFSCGSKVDVYDGKNKKWRFASFRHNGKDYYLPELGSDKSLSGVLVRKKYI